MTWVLPLSFWLLGQFAISESDTITSEPFPLDSIHWETIEVDSLYLGEASCLHEWSITSAYGALRDPRITISCAVLHSPGYICNYGRYRERMCPKCHRRETQQRIRSRR